MKLTVQRSKTVKVGDSFEKFLYEIEDETELGDIDKTRNDIVDTIESWLNEDIKQHQRIKKVDSLVKDFKKVTEKRGRCVDCNEAIDPKYKRCYDCNVTYKKRGVS